MIAAVFFSVNKCNRFLIPLPVSVSDSVSLSLSLSLSLPPYSLCMYVSVCVLTHSREHISMLEYNVPESVLSSHAEIRFSVLMEYSLSF